MAPVEERPTDAALAPPTALTDRLDTVVRGFDHLRDRPIASTIVAAGLVAVAAFAWWSGRPGQVVPVEARIPQATIASIPVGDEAGTAAGPMATTTEPPQEMLVHVAGAVRRPGIVVLDPGSRIGDAVAAAGGPTGDADVHQLNLAAPVVDGLQVRVPVEGELVAPTGVAPQTVDGADGRPSLVDVNSANEAQLEALPGIGPSLAAAIVEHRAAHGPFASIDDLLDVPGIGPAKLDRLVDLVVL